MESLVLANQAATADFRKHSGTSTLMGRRNTNVEDSITTYGVVENLLRSEEIQDGEQISINPELPQPVTNLNIPSPSAGATKLGHTDQPESPVSAVNMLKLDRKRTISSSLRPNRDGKSEAQYLNITAPSLSQSLLSNNAGLPTLNSTQAELPAGTPLYAPECLPAHLPAVVPSKPTSAPSLEKPRAKAENRKDVQPTSSQAVDLLLQSWTVQKVP